MYAIDRPVRFTGTREEREANEASHRWGVHGFGEDEEWECWDCMSKSWHAAAEYPCGVRPPREVITVG